MGQHITKMIVCIHVAYGRGRRGTRAKNGAIGNKVFCENAFYNLDNPKGHSGTPQFNLTDPEDASVAPHSFKRMKDSYNNYCNGKKLQEKVL